MRLVIDTLIALMLAGILGAVILHYRYEQRRIIEVQQVHQSLSRMQEQALMRGALEVSRTGEQAFPHSISPLWFNDGLPMNALVPPQQPWLDVAPKDDRSDQPPDPVIYTTSQAAFWYNPSRGIFRARIIAQFTEQATLDLYNRVNGTLVRSLSRSDDPARRPRVQGPDAGLSDAGAQAGGAVGPGGAGGESVPATTPTLRSQPTNHAPPPIFRNGAIPAPNASIIPSDDM